MSFQEIQPVEGYTAGVTEVLAEPLVARVGRVVLDLFLRLADADAVLDAHVLAERVDVPEHLTAGGALEGTVAAVDASVGGQGFLAGKTDAAELADVGLGGVCDWPAVHHLLFAARQLIRPSGRRVAMLG